MSKPIVFYHYPCLDGFTAAWACWKKNPDWEYVGLKYGQDLPDVTGRNVYFLDVTLKRDKMVPVIEAANRVVVIDHHKTAEADLSFLQMADPAAIKFETNFDMNKSGARLAWEYFFPRFDVPLFVKLVEDRDLWRFDNPLTKAANAYYFSFPYDFGVWEELNETTVWNMDAVEAGGEAILRKQAKDIEELAPLAFKALVGDHVVPVINVPYIYASAICNKLAEGQPFAASYYYDGVRNKNIVSLRSTEDGIDVSEVAKRFGGGGHKHAAGFETECSFTGV